jgi:hypothetical protein
LVHQTGIQYQPGFTKTLQGCGIGRIFNFCEGCVPIRMLEHPAAGLSEEIVKRP